jgi:hypothetical protein
VHSPSCLASKYLGNKHMYLWKPFLTVKYIGIEEGIVFQIDETKAASVFLGLRDHFTNHLLGKKAI